MHGPSTGSGHEGSGRGLAIALALAVNMITLLGVVVFGWPPGNAYALFWVENLIIGLWNVPRILSARGQDGPGKASSSAPVAIALFFCVHYGIFCLVHGVFTGIVAYSAGFRPTPLLFGVPIALILIRYSVETLTTWWGPHGLRWQLSPSQTMFSVYPRIIVLHVSILLAFFVVLSGGLGGRSGPGAAIEDVLGLLPGPLGDPGVSLVVILVMIKTAVDVATTRRTVTRR